MITRPINFMKWIEENRHLLKPPVGNRCVYEDAEFIVMVVGGPNSRKDFHFEEGEEFFYQLEGDITVKIQEDGRAVDVTVREGEIFLLPPRVPHNPIRGTNTAPQPGPAAAAALPLMATIRTVARGMACRPSSAASCIPARAEWMSKTVSRIKAGSASGIASLA